MKQTSYIYALSLLTAALLLSCGGNQTKRQGETSKQMATTPKNYTYTIRNTYPHLTTSYTQGLQFIDGVMWEGTGQHGESVLQTIDLENGKAKTIAKLPDSEFGEGITVLGDSIYQLTWQSNTAYLYDRKTGKEIKKFRYAGEGWGLTSDGESLYMSNGTAKIYKINPQTFRREGSITATVNGVAVNYLNELEWINGKIWANVYTLDEIVIIDPKTGVVEGVIDLTNILPQSEVTDKTDVLNGIAYDAKGDRVFVTGKNWSKIFEIEIIEKR